MDFDIQDDGIVIGDGYYPTRVIEVNGRGYRIGSESLREIIGGDADIKFEYTDIDELMFHYIDDELIENGSDEDIIKAIEANDVSRNEW